MVNQDGITQNHGKHDPHGGEPGKFSARRGILSEGAVSNTAIQGALLSGECAGTYAPYYRVQVELDEAGIAETSCTCLYEYGGYCKHIVALLLAYLHQPKLFAARKAPAELLADLDHNDLIAILTKLIQEQPDLYDRIEAMTSVPSKSKKQRKKKWISKSTAVIFSVSSTAWMA